MIRRSSWVDVKFTHSINLAIDRRLVMTQSSSAIDRHHIASNEPAKLCDSKIEHCLRIIRKR